MLGSGPPGFNANSPNKQALGVLSTPGIQSNPASLGVNYQTSPFAQISLGGVPGTSNFTDPSSKPANLNQWTGSQNNSSLLRALLGNTTTSRGSL